MVTVRTIGVLPPTVLAAKEAAMAPATIWPSTPMFHSPAAKVTTSPAAAIATGAQAINVSESLVLPEKAPSPMSLRASNGGALASNRSPIVAANATMIGARTLAIREPIDLVTR